MTFKQKQQLQEMLKKNPIVINTVDEFIQTFGVNGVVPLLNGEMYRRDNNTWTTMQLPRKLCVNCEYFDRKFWLNSVCRHCSLDYNSPSKIRLFKEKE